jgi:3-deoxy-7-phosphoheptulonate synthase
LREAEDLLVKAGLPAAFMVDCSHANSAKQHSRQEEVWRDLIEQRAAGNQSLIGVMVESYLKEGNQPFPKPAAELTYGISITDACIGWDVTERMLRSGAETLARANATVGAVG